MLEQPKANSPPPNIRKQMNEITQSTLKKRLIHRSNSTM